MCAAQMGYFLTKKPETWVSFWSKKSLEGPVTKIAKNYKISHFWGRNTLANGSKFAKISRKLSIQAFFFLCFVFCFCFYFVLFFCFCFVLFLCFFFFFEWEKSLDMGRGFRPQATHSVKKKKKIESPRGF